MQHSATAILAYGPGALTLFYVWLKIYYKIKRERSKSATDQSKKPMNKLPIRFLGLLVLASLSQSGCNALLPHEHKEQVAVQSAGTLAASHSVQVTKAAEQPPVTVNARGLSRVDMKLEAPAAAVPTRIVETDTQQASGSDQAKASSLTKIPLWFGMLMGLVCLAILFGLIAFARSKSAAVDAAFKAGDAKLAGFIAHKRTEAMSTTDPAQLAKINADIAHLESERGKLSAL